jgi:effector-binding domain-containing protein
MTATTKCRKIEEVFLPALAYARSRSVFLYNSREMVQMIGTPKLEERTEQHYVGIRTQATMQELARVIPDSNSEVAAWLRKQGVAPAGAPFVRYLVIDMEALLEIAVGFPVASALPGDEHVTAGVLPAGRYASLVYTGIDNGIEANKVLLFWGRDQGLEWDTWDTEKGSGWGARFETFLTNSQEEPDQSKWQTEVAIRLADEKN